MSRDLSKEGERVGSSGYAGYYDYAIDAGFNPNGIKNQGSALFLHCSGEFKEYTSGCVAIEKDQMAQIMKLYGKYGSGASFIAQAPKGTFEQIYNTYGTNQDCRRKGTFRDHDSIMNYGLHNYGLHSKRKLTFQNPYVRIQNCAEEDSEYHPESSFLMRLCAKICRRQVFAYLYRRVPPLKQILRKTRKQIVNRMRKMNGNSKI